MDIISKILTQKEFFESPPVLIDIGASGALHSKWKSIAKHSICIAFDADNREMGFAEKESDTFKKLIVFSSVVTDQSSDEIDFFLTKSPFCSSSLEPDIEKLKSWSFQDHFRVEKKIRLKAIGLTEALKEVGIDRIDWMKTDTQGTDLRLFKNLPENIRNKVIVVEFEPGILDAYKGEDKLYEVIQYMDHQGFFMSAMKVVETHRISPAEVSSLPGIHRKAINKCMVMAPGWAEVCYLNGLSKIPFEKRTYLLTFLFAFIEKQYGFALEVAKSGLSASQDPFFSELKEDAIRQIKSNNLRWPRVMFKRAVNKIVRYL